MIAKPSVCFAPAKLNLFLEIVNRRADGFHELETLMITIDLFDTLEFYPNDGHKIRLTCSDESLPTDARNLVYRAAENWEKGCDIHLTKRIPSQAGMGGGSSDAANTLLAMEKIFGPNTSRKAIKTIADELGSDIGFFLNGSAAWCTGRGEMIEPLPMKEQFHFVVVKPAVGCPTAAVYKKVKLPSQPVSGHLAREAIANGDPEQLARGLWNRLQEPAFEVASEVRNAYNQLQQTKALAVQVTGSGSAIFALARDRRDAVRIFDEYKAEQGTTKYVVRSFQG